jgi:hypothetical protein
VLVADLFLNMGSGWGAMEVLLKAFVGDLIVLNNSANFERRFPS